MVEILKANVSSAGVLDTVASLGVKHMVDGFAMPIVGNNNFISGIAKLAVGTIIHGKAGRVGNVVSNGMILDGADDLYLAIMSMVKGKSSGSESSAEQAW